MKYKQFYRRELPHIQPKGGTFFVTFRLYGSVPKSRIKRLKQLHKEMNLNLPTDYYYNYDRELNGPYWLDDPQIANIVISAMKFWDQNGVDLICYCLMGNHVHIVVKVWPENSKGEEFFLAKYMKSIKTFSSRKANEVLGRTGQPFWRPESYDSLIKNEKSLRRVIKYILDNPVKAGFVWEPEDWPWSFVHEDWSPWTS